MESVPADPFDVPLAELRGTRRPRRFLRQGEIASDLVADVDSRVPAGAVAVADVTLEAFDGGVVVAGTVASCWQGECRRCLAPTGGELKTEVKELFRLGGGQDEGTYPVLEDHVNLREMVLDALFAALPATPLCQEECAGLCPHCGTNRNTGTCDCTVDVSDPRWSALDALRGQPGGAGAG